MDPAEYREIFTLIEGIGCSEGPFFNYDKSKGCDYLAYVVGPESYCSYPLVFPLFNTQYASVRGCKMLTGDEVSSEWDGGSELTCELVDGKLHVYGNVWLVCASDHYAYFMEEPTEDPMVHILRFYNDISSLYLAYCQGKYQTDFWVPGFGPGDNENAPEGYDPSKIKYIVVDEYGKEFPVINKTQEDEYEIDDDDYIPFVVPGVVVEPGFEEPGKSWYVVHTKPGENPNFMDYSMWLSDNYNFNKYYLSSTEIVRDGNIYYKMNGYLLREKDRKVYVYSEDDQKEYLLYDFSLKEGDTFTSYDVYSGKTMNLKVLKEGWLTDGPRVFQSDKTMTYEELKEHKRPLRTWLIGREMETDVYPPEYEELFTLIEGVGCNEGPFFSYDKTNGCDYLAYLQAERPIETNQGTEYLYDDLSFPILNTRFANVHGFEMQTGEKSNTEPTDWPIRHELTFELEDGQLHGYGYAYTVCCGNDYAYIIETPTENPLVHLLHFKIDVSSSNYCDCTAWHKTDFWVPGFGPGDNEYAPEGYDPSKIEYIVVDENGNEYPVINKQSQTTTYRPFIEEDKVWKVGVTDYLNWSIDNPVEKVEYFYFDGDTIIDGKSCKRMMEQISAIENGIDYNPNAFLTYIGAWYENGHKVYFAAPNQPLHLMYDFSVSEGDTVRMDDGFKFTFTKTVGDIKGFKGVCYNLHVPIVKVYIIGMETLLLNVWLEGVGSATRPDINMDPDLVYLNKILLSCSVGDEIIYLNDKYDDIIPLDPEAPKRRIDFTHTVKVKPKAPVRRTNEEAEESLIGEYNDHQLYIRLESLNKLFIVTIKDQNDSVVYNKSVRANEIVALNIDISDYTDGDYSVCMENDEEAFNGMFTIEPTAIHDVMAEQKGRDDSQSDNAVYDLTGRRLSNNQLQHLAKGIYIIKGKKVLVR